MVVNEKIEEANYFLDKIKKATDREDFIPNLSAFLCSSKSIPEYLLEDYNIKYGLRISLDKRLDKSMFEEVARKRKNSNAIALVKGYNHNFNKLKKDKIAKLLLSMRNIKAHRTDLPLQKNVSVSTIENVDKQSTISNTKVKWSFDDYNADVVESCEKFLQLMKEFVNKVTTEFP
jgi:ribosomal protein L7Ae-like RNA K-turn-binding protein